MRPVRHKHLLQGAEPDSSKVPVSDLSKSRGTNLYLMHIVLLQCLGKTPTSIEHLDRDMTMQS
jgi:hypothetical protein